ncbi:MAG: hypothetical protein Q4B96_05280 [Bacillota bacterium]|nr:hypothetical protein [Bacillota bacterium]
MSGWYFNDLSVISGMIGVLAFIVSLITQMTKELRPFKLIPTQAQVIVTSLLLCEALYFAYVRIAGAEALWYMAAAAGVGAFIVAFIAIYGWERLHELALRFGLNKLAEQAAKQKGK